MPPALFICKHQVTPVFFVGVSVLHGVTSTERPQHVREYEDKPLTGLTEMLPLICLSKCK